MPHLEEKTLHSLFFFLIQIYSPARDNPTRASVRMHTTTHSHIHLLNEKWKMAFHSPNDNTLTFNLDGELCLLLPATGVYTSSGISSVRSDLPKQPKQLLITALTDLRKVTVLSKLSELAFCMDRGNQRDPLYALKFPQFNPPLETPRLHSGNFGCISQGQQVLLLCRESEVSTGQTEHTVITQCPPYCTFLK